ncbi:MAG: translational GTPase TypA [Gemmatimonadales bacterium]|jgi:GTP-binding protein|nr:translational GTPase TypA [Gemmatimonadales bacterium]MDG2239508.1 translational GTPase TypA [Longimicrobiales bacterium]MBT3775954.1 translational GTPase TypA [Gemmatimonadales bacterium]MBT3959006.1 translational GTPase TypA [Gemmatimonadales bacterium]MBT4187905.1 translational GTPase TypA [Gemmatimonadales bacterium]
MPIRNIAIIAHVDHGKTTLVDQMFGQAGVFRENQAVQERVMDSNPLERERGITILAKNTAVQWNDVKINIVDTPGHADFGGEVERILRMVDGVVLLVDAAEGPMPQTRFVTRKALDLGILPMVVINKVDRHDSRPHEVHDEVLELFMDLEATDEQLDAPFLYAVGRDGWASESPEATGGDLKPLFDKIVEYFPAPQVDQNGPFQMLVSTLDYSSYVGRIAIGRIERGTVQVGERVALLALGEHGMVVDGSQAEEARVSKLYTFSGLDRIEVEEAKAGDIVALAGLDGVEIGKTVTDPEHRDRMMGIAVEEPTLSVDFTVNNSPFAGQSGKFVTTRQVRERLVKELERNVSLRVENTDQPDTFTVSGRGELHLTILMETMRREGFEFQVSRPRVITRKHESGELQEPYEEAVVEVPADLVGTVIEKLGGRKGEMTEMRPMGDSGTTRLRFRIPARGLFGYRSEFMTDTRGEGILHHQFHAWGGWAGPLKGRSRGVLVADRLGKSVGFALFNLQDRATMFVPPGVDCYGGMIVGENARSDDMDVNVSKEKKLTNMRTTSSDENIKLEPPRQLTLELALEFIEDDELIEVTPDSIRLRKRVLDPNMRKKAAKKVSQLA